jgi:amino acid transporter
MLGPASVVAFGLSALLLSSVALCFAEAAASFEGHGGPYLYSRAVFGKTTGDAIGWLCWVAEVLSLSAVSNGIAVYLGYFNPAWASPFVVKAAAALVIILTAAINYRGVKLGAWTSNAFTAAKLIPLGVFVLLALPSVRVANFTPLAPEGWKPMGGACLLAFFAYSGFEVVPVPAGEVADARRAVPLAVISSLAFAALLYMAIQAAAVGVFAGLAQSKQPLADAAALVLGPWGAAMIVIGAVVSTAGFCAGAALGGPRYLVALAEGGDWPQAFAAPHPRFGTPYVSVAVTGAASLLAALALDFNKLVDITVVVICAQYLATCASVPLLRRVGKPPGGFRLPAGPLIPAFGIAATGWLAGGLDRDGQDRPKAVRRTGFTCRYPPNGALALMVQSY